MRILLLSFFLTFSVFSETIVFLGDSLTAGYGLDKEKSFPSLIAKELGDEHKVLNAGISGSTSASAISRLKWFLKSKPDILVLGLGANDGLRGIDPEHTYQNLAKTIEMALSKKIKVLLLGMKMPPNYGFRHTQKFEEVFSRLAKKYNIPLVPFLLKGVAAKKELNLADGIHPNEKGQKILKENVIKKLKELL